MPGNVARNLVKRQKSKTLFYTVCFSSKDIYFLDFYNKKAIAPMALCIS